MKNYILLFLQWPVSLKVFRLWAPKSSKQISPTWTHCNDCDIYVPQINRITTKFAGCTTSDRVLKTVTPKIVKFKVDFGPKTAPGPKVQDIKINREMVG